MRSSLLLLFGVLCLVLVVTNAHSTNDRINEVIAKHAAKWRNKVGQPTQTELKTPITAHKCIQDTHINPWMNAGHEKLRSYAQQKNLIHQEKKIEKATKQVDEYQNMRFFVNDDKIAGGSQDPNRACYSSGSSVCLVDWDSQGNFVCDQYTCTSEDILSNSLQTFLRDEVLPTLTEIFTEVIQVPVLTSNLVLNADAWAGLGGVCYPSDVAIPQSYTTTGVSNADFVVFVTARPCGDDSTVAYASACNYEVTDFNNFLIDRPLAGFINFCPRQFQQFVDGGYTDFEFQGAVKVAVHELTHALGFSSWMYDSYVDANGDHYDSTVKQFTRTGTSPAGVSYSQDIIELKTPKMLAYARDHYGCTGLSGVELEDFGGSGTAGSHWELRVAGDEYMCGYINPSMPVSGLTLSLFEDMGWYKTNMDKADYWGWGKDQGCDFLQDRCESSWPDADEGYWCSTDSTAYQCTADHKAKGQCRIATYSTNLEGYYQHFSNKRVGGYNAPADYCPFYESFYDQANYCIDTTQNENSALFEDYSASSACFHVVQGSIKTPTCYSYSCESETQLTVTINGNTFACPPDGGEVSVDSQITGASLSCPPASLFCRTVQGVGGSSANTLSVSILAIFMVIALVF